MAVDSREKGKRGERLAAAALRELFGWTADECRRAQQYKGTVESCDLEVSQTPDVHWEIKFVEKLNLWAAMARAVQDCGPKVPVVMHKRSREDWLVTVRLSDLLRFCESVNRQGQ